MKAAIYARVSTKEQETENQLIELRKYVAQIGYEVDEFVDKGFSGALSEDKRPGLSALMNAVRKRKYKLVAVWDLSRFARSLKQLVFALEEFQSLKIDFISYRQNLDTTTPIGRLMFNMIGSFAEFEREMIRERVLAGMAHAKIKGKVFGRPRAAVDLNSIVRLAGGPDKPSLRQMAKTFGVSYMTISRLLSQNGYQKIPSLP